MADEPIPEPEPGDIAPYNPELDRDDDDLQPGERPWEDPDAEEELEAPTAHPINWDLLSAEDAEYEWLALNEWVHWLRKTYGLPASIVPPYWHRHSELVWELSALHLHWIGSYDPEQNGAAALIWHRDFAAARERLREWVTISGTKLDRDRATRQTIWPGEAATADAGEVQITDREEDFTQFVLDDVTRRHALEAIRAERPSTQAG